MKTKHIVGWMILIVIFLMVSNPLRRSEEYLRSRILQDIPLGSSLVDVEDYVVKQEWEIRHVRKDKGFLHQGVRPIKIVGSQSIRAEFGYYLTGPFRTYITIFFGFNDESKLIDIWVWKTIDSL